MPVLRGFILGIALTILLAVVIAYSGVKLGLVPANADVPPGPLERWIARASLQATLARESGKLLNPLSANAQTLLAGIKIYGANCAMCHGDSAGRPTYVGFGLYQHAPALGWHGVEDDPDGETYWKVTHGIRFTGMPSFGRTLTDTQRWQVTTFLKHMNALPPIAQRAWKQVSVRSVPASLLPKRPPPR